MRGLAAVFLAALPFGRVFAAERAVAPIEVSAPLTTPVQTVNTMPTGLLGGGMLGLAPLDWRAAGSPAALAAQIFLPPSLITNFAARPTASDARGAGAMSATAAAQASQDAAQPQGAPRKPASGAMGGEAGVIPIEDLGEGSRLPAASRPQDRLAATEAALRAPLSQLRDAPSDSGGESLHALSGRVWDMMSGRAGTMPGPNAGRSAFAGAGSAAGAEKTSAPLTPSVPPSAAQAPLEPPSLSPLPGSSAASPASLALVLMDVVEQKLSLSVSAVPRLMPGRDVRLVKPEDVPAPYVAPAPAVSPISASGAQSANAVPEGAQDRALPGADLPSFAWRAEAEMVSFGETGTAAQAAGAEAGAPAAAATQQKVIASDMSPDFSAPASVAPRRAAPPAPPAPSAAEKLAAALPFSALLALVGAALLAWPDRR